MPSGTWKPQLNFAWGIILDQMLPGPNSQFAPKGSFQDFFRIVVDGEAITKSKEMRYGLNLFLRIAILFDCFRSAQALGITSLPKVPEESR